MNLWVAHHPQYCHPLPEGHRFPMVKYERIPAFVRDQLPQARFIRPEPMPRELVALTHCKTYLTKLDEGTLTPLEIRKIGFPFDPVLVEREYRIVQGTYELALMVLEQGGGIGLNTAGGTHHAFFAHGEGYCIFNDAAVAANALLHHQVVSKILILDLDVHQGNGTAELFKAESRVFTVSMHSEKTYPLDKKQSDLDISLAAGMGDAEYLKILKDLLKQLNDQSFDIMFFNAGVDVLATDTTGKLGMTKAGCAMRDRLVFDWAKTKRLPVVVTMGGGYSSNPEDVIEAHCNTFVEAARSLSF